MTRPPLADLMQIQHGSVLVLFNQDAGRFSAEGLPQDCLGQIAAGRDLHQRMGQSRSTDTQANIEREDTALIGYDLEMGDAASESKNTHDVAARQGQTLPCGCGEVRGHLVADLFKEWGHHRRLLADAQAREFVAGAKDLQAVLLTRDKALAQNVLRGVARILIESLDFCR